jgi:hypothetical protein
VAGYEDLLAPLPPEVSFVKSVNAEVDVVHLFIDTRTALASKLAPNMARIRQDAAIWISWPKKSSGVATDGPGRYQGLRDRRYLVGPQTRHPQGEPAEELSYL